MNQTCPRSSVKNARPMLCVIIINCIQKECSRIIPACTKGIRSSCSSISCYVLSLQFKQSIRLEPVNQDPQFKVALYSFFGARGMGANGASARVFKRKVKTKNKHGGETFIASRVPLTAILFDQNKCSSKNA